MAVDLGFDGLQWLQSDGSVTKNETAWLHRLDPGQKVIPEALRFWDALRAVGTSPEVGAFIGPTADRPHFQNWNDAGVSMAARLANLLTRSGTMRWRAANSRYSSDFGLGGEFFEHGTAAQIWNLEAIVTADMLARTRAAQADRFGQQRPGGPPRQAPAWCPASAPGYTGRHSCHATFTETPVPTRRLQLAELDPTLNRNASTHT